jgi:hypothetical protein
MGLKRDPTHQWFPTNSRLIAGDVCQIVNDWEEGWKTPENKMGKLDEE